MKKSKKTAKIVHHTDHISEPRVIDNIRAKANLGLVDVVAGLMTLNEVKDEITNLYSRKSPKYMVVLIEKGADAEKYHATLYITKEDFDKPIRKY